MAECPSCGVHLVSSSTPKGEAEICPKCLGRAATFASLDQAGASATFLRALLEKARVRQTPGQRRCPHCGRRMAQVVALHRADPLVLDVCASCELVWFDAEECRQVPRFIPLQERKRPHLDREEVLSKFKAASLRDRQVMTLDENDSPDETWQWLPGLLGLPVEVDAPGVERRPWVTWGIIALCTLSTIPVIVQYFSGGFHGLRSGGWVQEWGFIPSQWSRHFGLTMLTCFFLHGGILHLLSNMYFLAIFGDNVEDNLGKGMYAALVAGAHAAGLAAHGLLDPHGNVPLVGASGGISGVIAYYAIAYPRVRLGILFRYFVFFRWLRISAAWALALFVALQLLGAVFQLGGFGGVSHLGHLGGLVVGMALGAGVYFLRTRDRQKAAQSAETRDGPTIAED